MDTDGMKQIWMIYWREYTVTHKVREKICPKEKQSHKIIFMWFGNLLTFTKLQGFTVTGKNTRFSTIFSLKTKHKKL